MHETKKNPLTLEKDFINLVMILSQEIKKNMNCFMLIASQMTWPRTPYFVRQAYLERTHENTKIRKYEILT